MNDFFITLTISLIQGVVPGILIVDVVKQKRKNERKLDLKEYELKRVMSDHDSSETILLGAKNSILANIDAIKSDNKNNFGTFLNRLIVVYGTYEVLLIKLYSNIILESYRQGGFANVTFGGISPFDVFCFNFLYQNRDFVTFTIFILGLISYTVKTIVEYFSD